MSQTTSNIKPGFAYNAFKAYLRFLHDRVFYKRTYIINQEAIPSYGTPVLIVSNHQNCLNDPLGVLLSLSGRKTNVITRADVFALSPLANKFLRSIGLLPAFRLGWEGEAALGKNAETFKMSEEALLNGNTVLMYPEGGHQDKHWLGSFSFGYTKLAFEAAEMGNFEKEIFILPSCNHYSDYFGIQKNFMVKFGTPISLQPYYELYKTKPRTAQREVNKLVRAQIEGLMLNITDLDNYDEVYSLTSDWGKEYAESKDIDPDNLPEMLLIQKDIAAKLDEAKAEDETGIAKLYAEVKALNKGMEETGIDYKTLAYTPSKLNTLLSILLLIFLFPLFIFSLWPSLPIYAAAMGLFKAKSTDKMFEGTFLLAISALLTIPLCAIITLIVGLTYSSVLSTIVHILCFPILLLFAWKYKEGVKNTWRNIKYFTNKTKIEPLISLKNSISERMSKVMQNK